MRQEHTALKKSVTQTKVKILVGGSDNASSTNIGLHPHLQQQERVDFLP
jgi:hypothetical protein